METPATPLSLEGAQVTITGGTGSFGSTMVRHLLERGVGQINVLSRDEAKQDAMRRSLEDSRLRFFLGDVRDRTSIDPAMRGTDYVFHAAALKQVPSCEFFPQQAVYTNVLGSSNVIESAAANGVQSLVVLSTDKAVYPINAMGMTKGLMEKTAQAFARNNPDSQLRVAVTRYGNVMYSRGSVIPLFVQQLRSGHPLTLTEPTMTRFLMTLAQSVELVEYAWQHAQSGDLFVMKSPATTVDILARATASLLGEEDPRMQVIGLRHGEKMYECLLSVEERLHATDLGRFFRVPLDARSLQYEQYFSEGRRAEDVTDYNSNNAEQLDREQTKDLMRTLPEIQALIEATGGGR